VAISACTPPAYRPHPDVGQHRELGVQALDRRAQLLEIRVRHVKLAEGLVELGDPAGELPTHGPGRRDRVVEVAQQPAGPVEQPLVGGGDGSWLPGRGPGLAAAHSSDLGRRHR
jgi:hypothetical protein